MISQTLRQIMSLFIHVSFMSLVVIHYFTHVLSKYISFSMIKFLLDMQEKDIQRLFYSPSSDLPVAQWWILSRMTTMNSYH